MGHSSIALRLFILGFTGSSGVVTVLKNVLEPDIVCCFPPIAFELYTMELIVAAAVVAKEKYAEFIFSSPFTNNRMDSTDL